MDDSSSRSPFLLFTAGALLFAAAVALCLAAGVRGNHLLELLTPLFGLPYLLVHRRGGWTLAAYLLVLLPAFHFLAIQAAVKTSSWTESNLFVDGLVGGLVGSILSFAALRLLGLLRPGAAIGTIAAGIVVLALLGGLGVWQMNFLEGTAASDYGILLSLYLPWQIAFGYFLARLLRPVRPEEPAPG